MAKLIALTPCADMLPVTAGGVTLSEVPVDRLMSIAPLKGQKKAASDSVKAQLGVGLPGNGRANGPVTWFGHGVYMVAADVSLDAIAAVTDQTDAWAVVAIEGDAAQDVLARLVPVDLRAAKFKVNHVAKSMLGHLSVTVVRVAADRFEIMTMRSMAHTLVHDLGVAMRGCAAR